MAVRWSNTARAPRAQSIEVAGTVEQTNDRGLRLNGEWYNYSRFRQLPWQPEPGQCVRLVAREGWIEELAADGGTWANADRAAAPSERPRGTGQANGYARGHAAPAANGAANGHGHGGPPVPPTGGEDRDRRITRLACLKAAADLHSGRAKATPDDVLHAAVLFEAWASGGELPTADEIPI